MNFPNLKRLLEPHSVMIIGASERLGSPGRILLENVALHSDFQGELFPINPKREHVLGYQCWPAVDAVPVTDGVDVAILAVPAEQVMEQLRACARIGVRFTIVVTSGFAETGEVGQAMQRQMKELADSSGMRIYGPNSPGLTNLGKRLGLTFSSAFRDDVDTGNIALITQGGGIGRCILQSLGGGGPALNYWASVGNEVDLQVSDFIHFAAHQPDIKVIAVVVEGFNGGRKFMTAARVAAVARKPVIVLKIGRSEYGVKAAKSHTASLAGTSTINSAVFRELNVVEVDDIDELIETAALFSRMCVETIQNLCVYSFSGGAAAFLADVLGVHGLTLSTLSPETIERLMQVVPDYASIGNPVDLSTDVFSNPESNPRCLRTVLEDGDVSVLVVPFPGDYGTMTDKMAADLANVANAYPHKLIVPVWMSDRTGRGYVILQKAGLRPFRSVSNAALAIARVSTWFQALPEQTDGLVEIPSASHAMVQPRSGILSEPECKKLLVSYGITVPAHEVVISEDNAVAAAHRLGYPLVMKIVADGIVHKTEVEGVKLNLTSESQVRSAYELMLRTLTIMRPTAKVHGVLMEKMQTDPGVELLIGVHRDEVFGPILTFGLGGIWVETLSDVSHRTIPFDIQSAASMIREIKAWPLLQGARGRKVVDIAALENTLLQISHMVVAHGDALIEMDINPLWIGEQGRGVIALDAFIRMR